MKVKPVMDAPAELGAEVILAHTGQHYDPAITYVFFRDLGIRRPDYFLGAGSGSHATQTCRVMTAFEPLAEQVRPDIVVVVGDVNSTMAPAVPAAARPRIAAALLTDTGSRERKGQPTGRCGRDGQPVPQGRRRHGQTAVPWGQGRRAPGQSHNG